MGNKHYIGIAVDDEYIVGIQACNKDEQLQVEDTYQMQRQGEIVDDLKTFGDMYHLRGMHGGIVQQGSIQQVFLDLPYMTKEEVRAMLNWQIAEYISWESDSYYYDFVIQPHGKDRIYVLIIAVLHNAVNSLVEGLKDSGICLEIIDYWPSPIQNLFDCEDSYMMVLAKKEEIVIYHWFHGMLVFKENSKSPDKVLDAMARSNDIVAERYGIFSDKSIVFDEERLIGDEILDNIYATYPMVQLNELTISPTALHMMSTQNVLWQVALGLAYRVGYQQKRKFH